MDTGGIPLPAIGLSIGIGGQMHYTSKLSRKAIRMREWTDTNSNDRFAILERVRLAVVKPLDKYSLGIEGDTTALVIKAMMVSTYTDIYPVAVNLHCWIMRRDVQESISTEVWNIVSNGDEVQRGDFDDSNCGLAK